MKMHRLSWAASALHCNLLFAGLAARAPMSNGAGADRHADGLALEHRGDEKGAFIAFLDAAEDGYPPARRRLGEIYDSGNSVVERDYAESIRWRQKAREGGEQNTPTKSYGISPMPAITLGH